MTNQISPIHPDTEQASKERLRLWLKILKTSRLIENELREKLRVEHNTTLPRFDVLAALYKQKAGMKMSALSSELKVSNGNVTGIIDRLVTDGLVLRVPVEGDRRAMIVRLTQKGREIFERQAKAHESWVDDLLSALDKASAQKLTQQLSTITKRLEEKG